MADYCNICGSIKVAGVCSNRRLHDADYRSRCWLIAGTEYVFLRDVTRIEAAEAVKCKDFTVIRKGAWGYIEQGRNNTLI